MRVLGLLILLAGPAAASDGITELRNLMHDLETNMKDNKAEAMSDYMQYKQWFESTKEDLEEQIASSEKTRDEQKAEMESQRDAAAAAEEEIENANSEIVTEQSKMADEEKVSNGKQAKLRQQIVDTEEAISNVNTGLEKISATQDDSFMQVTGPNGNLDGSRMNDVINMLDEFHKNLQTELHDAEDKLQKEKQDLTMAKTNSNNFIRNKKLFISSETEKLNNAKEAAADAEETYLAAKDSLKKLNHKLTKTTAKYNSQTRLHEDNMSTAQTEIDATHKANGMIDSDSVTKAGAASFLQLRTPVVDSAKLEAFLTDKAAHLKSAAIAQIATAVLSDPFGKVRNMIDKMIVHLREEGNKEQDQDGQCRRDLGQNKDERNNHTEDLQKASAMQDKQEARSAKAKKESKQLNKRKARLLKEKARAIDNREKQHKANEKVRKLAKNGKESILSALETLKVMFEKISLIQDPSKEEFHGTSGGNAAIDAVQMVADGLAKQEQEAEDREKKEQDDHDEYLHDCKISEGDFDSDIDNQDARATKADEEAQTAKKDKASAKTMLDTANDTYESLKKTCIDSNESHEQRQAKRQAEIESLQEALEILKQNAE